MRTLARFALVSMLLAASAVAADRTVPTSVVERVRAAAEAGGAGSQIVLAQMHAHGTGVPRDRAQALRWSRRAAAQGTLRAYEQLGALLSVPEASREEQRESLEWQRKAAEAGHIEAQLALARALQLGHAAPIDEKQAADWLRRAAEQDDAQGAVGLAYALFRGRGVRADHDAAVGWLLWPAGEPREEPLYDMARAFRDGNDGRHPQDAAFAQVLYAIAAEEGDTAAAKEAKSLAESLDRPQRAEASALFDRWRNAREAQPPHLAWLAQRLIAERHEGQRERELALAAGSKAVALAREAFGAQSPQLATSLEKLGWIQLPAEQPEAARESFTQALAIRRGTQGKEHRALIAVLHALGSERRSSGAWAEAAEFQGATLTLTEQHYGADSTKAALVLNALGTALYFADRNEEAVQAHRRELAIRRLGVPPAHERDLIDALEGLADALRAIEGEGQVEAQRASEALYREAIARIRVVTGTPHPIDAYAALEGLKFLLWDQDRYTDVVEVQAELIATLQHDDPVDAPAVAAAQLDLQRFRASAAEAELGPLGSAKRMQHDLEAAEKGDTAAQLALGNVHHAGLGVKRNLAQAAKWYRRAAEQGDMIGQYNLGILYTNGEGVPQDDRLAVQWLRKSAEQGFAEAQGSLGYMLEAGRGVARDTAEAVRMFRLAAEQESPNGRFNLANHLYQGLGVERDIPEAIRLYGLAAEQGWPEAQLELAGFYRDGEHVKADRALAIKWLQRAAEQGLPLAQANLGGIYDRRDASETDLEQAYFWMILAAQGVEGLEADRDALRARLKPARATDIEQRAAAWSPTLE